MSTLEELKRLLKKPYHIFVAIKHFDQQQNKTDLLAFILEQGANYSDHFDMIKGMALDRDIPMSSDVIVINITEELTKSEVEKMAQDIIDAIHDGEEEDYDPVHITLGDILE